MALEITTTGDQRLGAITGACVALSVAGVLLPASGITSAPVAAGLVLVPVTLGLRVTLTCPALTAGSAQRAKVMEVCHATAQAGAGVDQDELDAGAAVPYDACPDCRADRPCPADIWPQAITVALTGAQRNLNPKAAAVLLGPTGRLIEQASARPAGAAHAA